MEKDNMRILIVDDEKPARERLRSLIEALPSYEVCGEASNGIEALRISQMEHPDVVLMDIRMPGMDGLEAAQHLADLEQPPAIIFATAYGDHALDAFAAHAVDYLLKPVRRERLIQALGNARKPNRAQLIELGKTRRDSPRTHICAKLGERFKLIPIDQVLYFQAEQKYVTVRHRQGEVIIEESLKSLETELAPAFVRAHRNALVALAFIEGLDRSAEGRFRIVLKNMPECIEVSRRHLATVKNALKTFTLGSSAAQKL